METGALAESAAGDVLDWDSAFFGCRVARARARRLTPSSAAELLAWCAAQRVDCLYFLADASDPVTIGLAETHAFRCVDIRVTLENHDFEQHAVPPPFDGVVREVRPADVPALKAIARTGFRVGRFHFDGRFAPGKADELYEVWIERSCSGYADGVLAAEHGADVLGFITCHLHADSTGQIGLTGMRDDAQGHGLGRVLVAGALRWFAARGATRARVVTQGRNRGALRVYQRCGFLVDSVELYYHRWFGSGPAA
jgi:GNAT superfamily N-acetyltransferase